MKRLADMAGEGLWTGDILRLSDNYDLAPGSGPVDLMVSDPRSDEDGLGLIVVSGYKAGLTFCVLPVESTAPGKRVLEASWLLRHWSEWFVYSYQTDDRGLPLPIPLDGTLVLGWDEREIVVKR